MALGLVLRMNDFSTKFIIRSSVVVLGLFLTIYFLFNSVAQNFVTNIANNDLSVQIHNNNSLTMAFFRGEWLELTREEAISNFLDLPEDALPRDSLALAILTDTFTDNYVMINERGMIVASGNLLNMHAEQIEINGTNLDLRFFLTKYVQNNRSRFNTFEPVTIVASDRTFHARLIATDQLGEVEFALPTNPITILFFTEITEITDFRQSVNQILLWSLGSAGVIIIAVTIRMSIKFKQSIKKLSDYAKQLGHGEFNADSPTNLRYAEFQTLASSMSEMATMLASYEVNQKQFFQNASHELRTPLMAIQCYSEGIIADVFTPSHAVDVINSEVEKMTELVSSILYLSRIDYHSFNFTPTSMNEFLQNCYEEIKIIINNNHKTIIFNPLAQDLLVNVDADLLDRAVLNILTNALRYTKTEIAITAEPFINRNIFANIRQNMVRITIFNDGELIDEQDLPQIFDRFYKGKGGNTGIGLSITKEIVTSLNGNVIAKNTEHGVAFIIELPVLTVVENNAE